MYDIGLKIWSTNTGPLAAAAERLFKEGVFGYIELFAVPGSLATLPEWKRLHETCGIPFVIHNAHSAKGFNLAKRESEVRNREIYAESKAFADALGAEHIIFHGGTDGDVDETIRQLRAFGEKRALIENKPFVPLSNDAGVKVCRGATAEELERIIDGAGCGFCLDIGHAICSANSQGLEPYAFASELAHRFHPAIFHLSDVTDMTSVHDAHPHLGTGELDIPRICREVLPTDAKVSIETIRDSLTDLDDFRRDADFLRSVLV